ncbi:MAG: PilZ domain-containing protein [Rhodanobacter sp.]
MSTTGNQPGNRRSAERKRASPAATVTDVISGQAMGHVGNMSSTGMLLIGHRTPRSEALYQVCVTLRPASQPGGQAITISAGIQEQWHEPAASGQMWSGYRIVAITDEDVAQLSRWLAEG